MCKRLDVFTSSSTFEKWTKVQLKKKTSVPNTVNVSVAKKRNNWRIAEAIIFFKAKKQIFA